MSYATDDAEMLSAREILYLCRSKLLSEVRRKRLCSQLDALCLNYLEGIRDLLRDDTVPSRPVTVC